MMGRGSAHHVIPGERRVLRAVREGDPAKNRAGLPRGFVL
jgi:hypothetical protein